MNEYLKWQLRALREELDKQLKEAHVTLERMQGSFNAAHTSNAELNAQLKNKTK